MFHQIERIEFEIASLMYSLFYVSEKKTTLGLRDLLNFESIKKSSFERYHFSTDTFYDELGARMAESPLADQWQIMYI